LSIATMERISFEQLSCEEVEEPSARTQMALRSHPDRNQIALRSHSDRTQIALTCGEYRSIFESSGSSGNSAMREPSSVRLPSSSSAPK
jgi:hypothetical protein